MKRPCPTSWTSQTFFYNQVHLVLIHLHLKGEHHPTPLESLEEHQPTLLDSMEGQHPTLLDNLRENHPTLLHQLEVHLTPHSSGLSGDYSYFSLLVIIAVVMIVLWYSSANQHHRLRCSHYIHRQHHQYYNSMHLNTVQIWCTDFVSFYFCKKCRVGHGGEKISEYHVTHWQPKLSIW